MSILSSTDPAAVAGDPSQLHKAVAVNTGTLDERTVQLVVLEPSNESVANRSIFASPYDRLPQETLPLAPVQQAAVAIMQRAIQTHSHRERAEIRESRCNELRELFSPGCCGVVCLMMGTVAFISLYFAYLKHTNYTN